MADKKTSAAPEEFLEKVDHQAEADHQAEDKSADDERAKFAKERGDLDRMEVRQDKTETRIVSLEGLVAIVSALMIAAILFVGTNSYMVLKENRELREQVYQLQVSDELQKRDIQDLRDKLDGGEG